MLFTGDSFMPAIAYGQMSTINILLIAWLAAAVLTVPLLVFAVLAWKSVIGGPASRIHYTLVTAAALAFVWFLNYWNLLGFRY